MSDGVSKTAIKNNSLLRQRNSILKRIFEGTDRVIHFDSGLTTIDCAANMNYIIPKALRCRRNYIHIFGRWSALNVITQKFRIDVLSISILTSSNKNQLQI